jgi:pentatricopeptide repeat protein
MKLSQRIFNNFSKDELKSLNNSIKGYLNIGNIEKANKIFNSIHQPDKFTYSIMIYGMSKSNNLQRVSELFEESKTKFQPDVVLYSSYIDILSKNGNFKKCHELLEEMKEHNIKPNIVLFGHLFSGLTNKYKLRESLKILKYMKENHFEINEYHISMIMKIYAKMIKFSMDDIFKFLNEWNIYSTTIHNIVLTAFSNRNLYFEGIEYLKKFEPDVVSYNTLISSCCKSNKIKLAMKLFSELKSKNFQIDKNSIVPIITTLKGNGSVMEIKEFIEPHMEFFEKLMSDGQPMSLHISVTNSIVDALVELEPEIFILKVEDTILKKKSYDSVTIASISKMYLKQNKILEFEELMRKYRISLPIEYYNTLISHYISNNNKEKGIEIFNQMKLKKNLVTMNTMLSCYLEQGDFENALKLWNEIEFPNQKSYQVLVCGLFSNGNDELAVKVFDSMDIAPSLELKKLVERKKKKMKIIF